jgi:hypothetical protein
MNMKEKTSEPSNHRESPLTWIYPLSKVQRRVGEVTMADILVPQIFSEVLDFTFWV